MTYFFNADLGVFDQIDWSPQAEVFERGASSSCMQTCLGLTKDDVKV